MISLWSKTTQGKRSRRAGGGGCGCARKASSRRCHVNKPWSRCGCESLSLGEGQAREGKSECKAPEAGAAACSRTGERKRQRRQDKVRRTGMGHRQAGVCRSYWWAFTWKWVLKHRFISHTAERTDSAVPIGWREKAALVHARTCHRETLIHTTSCNSKGLRRATTTNVY